MQPTVQAGRSEKLDGSHALAKRDRKNNNGITSERKPNGEITGPAESLQISERGYFRSGLLTCWIVYAWYSHEDGRKNFPKCNQTCQTGNQKMARP